MKFFFIFIVFVSVTSRDLDGKAECFIVRNLTIPTGYHFGLTARTGAYNCNHDIISMKTNVKDPVMETRRVAKVKPSSSHTDQNYSRTDSTDSYSDLR